MTITKTLEGETLTIAVEGWLDTMTSPRFHAAVQDLGPRRPSSWTSGAWIISPPPVCGRPSHCFAA